MRAGETGTRQPDEDGVAWYRFTATEVEGPHVVVRSRSANGFVSAAATWQYSFPPWPGVTSDVYPETEPAGGAGVEGRFTFTPPGGGPRWPRTGTASTGSARTLATPAGEDGRATLVWAPTGTGRHTLTVRAVRADGTVSDYSGSYSFTVA